MRLGDNHLTRAAQGQRTYQWPTCRVDRNLAQPLEVIEHER